MHIAFIAMSGIRACDEELLAFGLTLPGFVERSKTIASLPSLGLLTLAGMSRDHSCAYYEAATAEDLAQLPAEADLIVISALSAQIWEAYELADAYRARGLQVVMGGLHVSACPDEAMEHASAVVVGQGEAVWPEVLADAEVGLLQPVYRARPGAFHLRDAPMPAYELLDIDRYNRITVQTQRGCPHRCSFCAASPTISPTFQQKPIAKVLAEIDAICARWPAPFIEFADDNSFVDRDWWKAFLPELAKRKVKWFTESDIAVADDDELLSLMKMAGCRQVLIGLEASQPGTIDGIELKRDWKAARQADYQAAIRRIQGHGITVNGCFVLGLDGHDSSCFAAVEDFVLRSGLAEVQITLLTPFPGTPMTKRLEAQGRLLHQGEWDRCTLFDICFEPKQMSIEELRRGFHGLMKRLYSAEATAARKRAFHQQWRASVAA